jgi:hypothetical protein
VPPLVEIPAPFVFDLLPFSPPKKRILSGLLRAATGMGTFAIVRESDWDPSYEEYLCNTMVLLDRDGVVAENFLHKLRMVEIPDGVDVMSRQAALKRGKPELVIAIRMSLNPASGSRIEDLMKTGAEVVHLVADEFGMEDAKEPLFLKDRLKEIHLSLVDRRLRDQITIVAGGGIAMAEHMAKLIICGADAVSCDIPLLVAMECRVCRRCAEGISCPVELDQIDPVWACGRVTNLMSGWHNQLLEIMGAMGMREVRRLRGEMGRAMFFEDLEREFSALGRRG